MYSHSDFTKALKEQFPELAGELSPNANLPHLQMGTFARFTQAAIDRQDKKLVQNCFNLAHRFFHDADRFLKNEFYVSFLEELNLEGTRGSFAKPFMSSLLLEGWKQINAYLDEIKAEFERKRNRPAN